MTTPIKTILTIVSSMLFSFCQTNLESQPILKGKVYSTSFGMDSTKCETIGKGADYFNSVMFINDSVFIQGFYTCCPVSDEEFLSAMYYSGIYKMDDSLLTLFYCPERIRTFERAGINDSTKKYVSSFRIAIENAPVNKLEYPRYNCNNIPYFKNPLVELIEFLTPDNKVDLVTIKSHLKNQGIWDKLFNDKNKLSEKIANEYN